MKITHPRLSITLLACGGTWAAGQVNYSTRQSSTSYCPSSPWHRAFAIYTICCVSRTKFYFGGVPGLISCTFGGFFLIFRNSQNLLILRPPGHQNRVSDLVFIYRDAPGLILVDSENFRKFQNFQPI